MNINRLKQILWLPVLIGALWLAAPHVALADAPGTRGEEPVPEGSAGAAGDWRGVRQLPPADAGPLALMDGPDMTSLDWLARQPNVGAWILDAGMGIGSAVVATLNYALVSGLRHLIDSAPGAAGCDGSLNILWCTPPELFLGRGHTIGGLVNTIWAALEPIAITLVGVLFTVRIGRLIVEGPRSLATEGKGLVVTFAISLVWITSADSVLRFMMSALNEFHGLVMTQAARELLAQPLVPMGTLNFGLQVVTLVLMIVVIALVVKALMRVVQLTVLIAVAPLMGALLMDRATSPRFGLWLGKLVDVLLQQTAWVFFLWFGALFYAQAVPVGLDRIEPMVTGRILATVIFGMALGGESILAGIAGTGVAPGGLVGGAVTSIASGRFAFQAARISWRHATKIPAPRPGAPASAPSSPPSMANPRLSAAAQRQKGGER